MPPTDDDARAFVRACLPSLAGSGGAPAYFEALRGGGHRQPATPEAGLVIAGLREAYGNKHAFVFGGGFSEFVAAYFGGGGPYPELVPWANARLARSVFGAPLCASIDRLCAAEPGSPAEGGVCRDMVRLLHAAPATRPIFMGVYSRAVQSASLGLVRAAVGAGISGLELNPLGTRRDLRAKGHWGVLDELATSHAAWYSVRVVGTILEHMPGVSAASFDAPKIVCPSDPRRPTVDEAGLYMPPKPKPDLLYGSFFVLDHEAFEQGRGMNLLDCCIMADNWELWDLLWPLLGPGYGALRLRSVIQTLLVMLEFDHGGASANLLRSLLGSYDKLCPATMADDFSMAGEKDGAGYPCAEVLPIFLETSRRHLLINHNLVNGGGASPLTNAIFHNDLAAVTLMLPHVRPVHYMHNSDTRTHVTDDEFPYVLCPQAGSHIALACTGTGISCAVLFKLLECPRLVDYERRCSKFCACAEPCLITSSLAFVVSRTWALPEGAASDPEQDVWPEDVCVAIVEKFAEAGQSFSGVAGSVALYLAVKQGLFRVADTLMRLGAWRLPPRARLAAVGEDIFSNYATEWLSNVQIHCRPRLLRWAIESGARVNPQRERYPLARATSLRNHWWTVNNVPLEDKREYCRVMGNEGGCSPHAFWSRRINSPYYPRGLKAAVHCAMLVRARAMRRADAGMAGLPLLPEELWVHLLGFVAVNEFVPLPLVH